MQREKGIPVHRKVMVDTVQQEMQDQGPVAVRQEVIDVEEESMEAVFEERPDDGSGDVARNEFGKRGGGEGGEDGRGR